MTGGRFLSNEEVGLSSKTDEASPVAPNASRRSIRATPGLDQSRATEEDLLAFVTKGHRINDELKTILDACAGDLRFPTDDENRRSRELALEYETAKATFERTLAKASQ